MTGYAGSFLYFFGEMNTFDRKLNSMQGCGITCSRRIIIAGLAVFSITVACDDTICPGPLSSVVQLSFNDIQSRERKYLKVDSIIALGADSVFYLDDSLALYTLPLDHTLDSTLFIFMHDSEADTLVVRYDPRFSFVSKDCGFTAAIDNIHTGFTTFPEVISNNEVPRQQNDPDIEIYF
ncbi:MAG TPA: DUF6452 family protein [Cyclobacteriaceae bacterium]|nr:DUF6452 family protein [Cyclobacteriaceae bacterium]